MGKTIVHAGGAGALDARTDTRVARAEGGREDLDQLGRPRRRPHHCEPKARLWVLIKLHILEFHLLQLRLAMESGGNLN